MSRIRVKKETGRPYGTDDFAGRVERVTGRRLQLPSRRRPRKVKKSYYDPESPGGRPRKARRNSILSPESADAISELTGYVSARIKREQWAA